MDDGAVEEDEATTTTTAPDVKKVKQPVQLNREPGKSLFPFSRVQKIIKADKDIPIMAKDATFLISLATEEFVKRLCQEAQRVAEREKRTTVQAKDLATIVRKADEFLFLEEILSYHPPEQPKRKPKAMTEKDTNSAETGESILGHFTAPKTSTEPAERESPDVIMNEDGTMDVEPTTTT
ncbi:histone-fold-containing protein [Marasmius fiardii PR-910]|nr:histone-fold-containing protein [Marasmius fiardii PR-910]